MWIYKDQKIQEKEELPNSEFLFGFVYCIRNLITGKIYIGKKQLQSRIKKKLTLKELSKDKRKKTYKYVTKESNWKDYNGSCDALLNDINVLGINNFKKEILELAYSKKYLGFAEIEHQIKNNVLKIDSYNDNILGTYFRKDMLNEFNNE